MSLSRTRAFFHSREHPNLKDVGSPKTKRGIQANRNKRKSSSQDRPSSTAYNKQQRLTNLNVAEFLVENNVKTETELFAHAKIQKEGGKKDLASFCLNRSSKSLQDLITNTWKMEGASAELKKKEVSRMDVV